MCGFGLEPLPPLAGGGDRRIEHARTPVDDAGLTQSGELVPRDGLDGASCVAEMHATATYEASAESRLQPAKAAEESVDGAPGRIRVSLIDGDRQEPVIPPLARNGEWLTMRPPLFEVRINLGEQHIDLRRREGTVRREHPDAG